MTKHAYVTKRFRPESMDRIRECNAIIERYEKQNLRLTLRQMYYQLVSKNIIPNVEKSYKTLGKLVSEARLAGLMSWEAIEDRIRTPKVPQQFDSLADLAKAASQAYRLPRWEGQDSYVELWVEKDALAGVLAPIAREYHVTLMVNRGYSSTSAMYESAQRFLEHRFTSILPEDEGKALQDSRRPGEKVRRMHLLYLGDHDPSGEDMVRDVGARLRIFGADVRVRKVALTMNQVEEYGPPPNPAKMTDSRASSYVDKHGNESWEVDAIPPEELARIIRSSLDALVDKPKMERVKRREEQDKKRLREAVKELGR